MLGYDDIPKQSADDVFEICLKNSFLMSHYRETVSKAVNYFDVTLQGDCIESSKLLRRCLEVLGRPLPTSRLDMACSLLWLVFRQIVHRLFITRWLTVKAAQWCSLRAVREKDVKYRQEAAKQAALVYHQLHQLHLTGFCEYLICTLLRNKNTKKKN